MSDFYLESIYLNLNKMYNNFSYSGLTSAFQSADEASKNTMNLMDSEANPNEGISQNKYQFIQEKDMLLSDVSNLCIFFSKEVVEKGNFFVGSQSAGKNFPVQKIKERICFIVQKYQEQAVLLDSVMEVIVTPIMGAIKEFLQEHMKRFWEKHTKKGEQEQAEEAKDENLICEEFHHLVSIVYLLCKTRGYKYVIKFFPHEVKDLEPVVFYLASEREKQVAQWDTKYVILLWLSIIILVPFDLESIDSKAITLAGAFEEGKGISKSHTLFLNIIEIGKLYLKSSSRMRDAAAIFLSKFFTRPDIQKMNLLADFLKWAQKTLEDIRLNPLESFFSTGIMSALVEIFKIGQRQELLNKTHLVIPIIISSEGEGDDKSGKKTVTRTESTSLRLLKSKLAQRIGMNYLKPRVVKWAYKRGNKSIIENVKKTQVCQSKLLTFNVGAAGCTKASQTGNNANMEVEADADDDIDNDVTEEDFENLEKIIELLLGSLRDKDTVVRWSAAKGIGRITGRLSMDMANEVLSSVLQLFGANEGEFSWHGGCLTLAELSRRGLLLPKRLNEIFPLINKALIFDQNQGNYSVGANVRDAACYVAWAFARAYDPEVLSPYVLDLAKHLLITCVYDREVNCRRAAAASFQEHVGRQGSFPHGIPILTEADYFTLGLKNHAYLNIGLYVSHFKEYSTAFIDHLALNKLKSFDIEIRRLSAAALSLITPLWPEYIVEQIIPALLKYVTNSVVQVRHGAIYGLIEIIIGLSGRSHLHNMKGEMKDSIFLKSLNTNERRLIKAGEYYDSFKEKYEKIRYENLLHMLPEKLLEEILGVVDQIEKARLFRGKGGEVMRSVVCRFIQGCAIAQLSLKPVHIKRFMDTLEECLKSPLEDIQSAASKALKPFSAVYGQKTKENVAYVEKFLKSASNDANVAVTRGYTRALGLLSKDLLEEYFPKVLEVLSENCKIKPKESDDADTRKYAVVALENVLRTLGLTKPVQENIPLVFSLCLQVMKDYTVDKRGDIGSIVREASMGAMINILKIVIENNEKACKNGQEGFSLAPSLLYCIVCAFLQQLVEKIDRIRLIAGSLLQDFSDNLAVKLPDFPHKAAVCSIFSKENVKKLIIQEEELMKQTYQEQFENAAYDTTSADLREKGDHYIYYWNQPHCVFPLIVPLMRHEDYTFHILRGLVVSVGGLTESIIKHSLMALTKYVQEISASAEKDSLLDNLIKAVLRLFKEHVLDERIITPLFKTLEHLLEKEEIFKWSNIKSFSRPLLDATKAEIHNTKSISKLAASTGVITNLLNIEDSEISGDIFKIAKGLLVHVYPMVRKCIADKLYIYLLASGDNIYGAERNDEICGFLMETEWLEAKDHHLKEIKTKLETLF